jgi:hypothetical protein
MPNVLTVGGVDDRGMTESATTLLSVRGDAELDVAPDLATLNSYIEVGEPDKPSAMRSAARHLDAIGADLRALGGEPLQAGAPRRPLGWLARSATSQVERRWRPDVGEEVATGRIMAMVAFWIEVRDFDLMEPVNAALARDDAVHVRHVGWSADADNTGWGQVRAAAIDAASCRAHRRRRVARPW